MPLPEIKHCLICEDIRLERRNLNSYMGVYGATPYVGIKIKDFKLPVPFVIVLMGAPADGKFVIEAALYNPDGARIKSEIRPEHFLFTFTPEMGASTLAFRFNAVFPGPNTYTIVLMHNDKVFFTDTFRLLQATDADFA
jgi:hypothetical protein